MVDWRAVLGADDSMELQPAASARDVAKAGAALGVVFPAGLRDLFVVSDGVLDKVGRWYVLWQLCDVITANEQAWANEGAARQGLVGFGDDGTGAPFCVPRDGSAGVYAWNPIDGAAYRLADTVEEFWFGWTNGSITT